MNIVSKPTISPLYRLNPLSKVLAPLPVLLFVALTTDIWTPLAFIVLTTALILGPGYIRIGRFLRNVWPLLLLIAGFVMIYPFLIRPGLVAHSPVLFELGPFTMRQAGLLSGLGIALRISAIVLLSLLFSLTTDPTDFIRALIQQWKFPYKIGYGALATFRFVPMLQDELRQIQAAHKIRGVTDRGGIRVLYNRIRRYTVPLLVTALRQAERTALAMDGRAFGATATRTYYRQLRFRPHDYLFIGTFWLVSCFIVFILWQTGLLGSLAFLQRV